MILMHSHALILTDDDIAYSCTDNKIYTVHTYWCTNTNRYTVHKHTLTLTED